MRDEIYLIWKNVSNLRECIIHDFNTLEIITENVCPQKKTLVLWNHRLSVNVLPDLMIRLFLVIQGRFFVIISFPIAKFLYHFIYIDGVTLDLIGWKILVIFPVSYKSDYDVICITTGLRVWNNAFKRFNMTPWFLILLFTGHYIAD